MLAALVMLVSLLPAQGESALQKLIASGRHPAMRWERFSDVQAEARSLYERNGWGPLWISGGRPTPLSDTRNS
jgi:hypothetical protein